MNDQAKQHRAHAVSRVAVVTGAARGIGLAVTERLLSEGHRVAMVDRDAAELAVAAGRFDPTRVLTVAVDLARADAADHVADAVVPRFGTVGILVNNAGIAPKRDGKAANVVEITLDEWQEVLAVNLTAPLFLCRKFVPGMQAQRWGRIVNLSSMAGRTAAIVNGPSYMASKAGLLGLTRHIAGAFAKDGITSNAIAPSRIVTGLSAQWSTPEREALYNKSNPTGRSGTVEEAAAAVAYLIDERAGFTNGAVIDLNGGAFMN